MDTPPLLVFDGDCGFCHRAVQFVLAHERRHDLVFIARSSPLGRRLREQHQLEQVESLLWIEGGQAYTEWQAVQHTAEYVGGIYGALASAARVLPGGLLNAAYRMVARFRKRFAGAPQNCLLLSAEQKLRFLQ